MLVEIASDVVCPWCFIGKRRFDKALALLAETDPTIDVTVRYRSYQLDPTAPLDNPTPVRETYARKFGGEHRAEQILTEVTRVAAAEGIEFRMHDAIRANTVRAHRLLKLVEAEAEQLQSAVNESIMQAYFSEGEDISLPETLLACAERAGFVNDESMARITSDDPAEVTLTAVHNDLQWARRHDITAVPTFVINDSFALPGAQEPETIARLMRRMSQR
jgi:predicted DsbA family dithiol-disulfide isomerase